MIGRRLSVVVIGLGLLAGACGVSPRPATGGRSTAAAAKTSPAPEPAPTTEPTAAPPTQAPATTTTTRAPAPPAPASGPGMVGGAGFSEGSSILWDSTTDLQRRLDGIAATGARWLRVDVRWPDIEQQRGVYQWGGIDRVVDAAVARGLDVLGILDFTPAWARPPGTTDKHPPTDPADYASFAAEAARHFGSKVRVYEIWNEPNSPIFWAPGADAAAYTALLVPAYGAIKAVDPTLTVLTGGTSPAATGGGWLAPLDFLTGVYAAGGGGHFDGVAHHPYNWPFMPMRPEPYNYNWNAFGGVTPRLHDLMVAHGDGAKRVWGTEMGAPVPATRQGVTTDNAYLAAYVTEAFTAWSAWPWTGPLLWYSYRDVGTNVADPEQVFGLVKRDYSPKSPALEAFVSAVAG